MERYHNAKTIEPNVLIVRFIRKSDRFKIDHVKFRATEDGDKEDYTFLNEHEIEYTKGRSNKLLRALAELDEGLSGYQLTRLEHSLQSATRAERDEADTERRRRRGSQHHHLLPDVVEKLTECQESALDIE